jgi:DNA polymerase I
MSRLYIVDGNNVVHRAHHAMKKFNFTSLDGHPTGAIYGFMRMIHSYIKSWNIEDMVICFDSRGTLKRHELYPEYKSNRKKNDEVSCQYSHVRDWCDLNGICNIAIDAFEADDIIHTVVRRFNTMYENIFILSTDKDLTQLVNEKVSVIVPGDNLFLGAEGIKVKYGVQPEYMRLYLALMGDTSDNIPGCRGIGKKSAAVIAELAGPTLEDLEKNFNKIKRTYADKITKDMDRLKLGYELIGLMTIKGFGLEKDQLSIKGVSSIDNLELFRSKFNFKSDYGILK